ncbi:hypothetical protein OPIT5_08975 [Opitutaceae bacterium TAV5]|nr:hypothetical protein OPIT5_08975 [Opitutaceae bacterium TAV5]
MHRLSSGPVSLSALLLLTGFVCGCATLCAEEIDYTNDTVLARTVVSIEVFRDRQAALGEIFPLVEKQTGLQFVYVASQLPLDTTMSFESGDKITLARLFTIISALTDVVFFRHETKIVVRTRRKDDNLVTRPMPHADRLPGRAPDNPSPFPA